MCDLILKVILQEGPHCTKAPDKNSHKVKLEVDIANHNRIYSNMESRTTNHKHVEVTLTYKGKIHKAPNAKHVKTSFHSTKWNTVSKIYNIKM